MLEKLMICRHPLRKGCEKVRQSLWNENSCEKCWYCGIDNLLCRLPSRPVVSWIPVINHWQSERLLSTSLNPIKTNNSFSSQSYLIYGYLLTDLEALLGEKSQLNNGSVSSDNNLFANQRAEICLKCVWKWISVPFSCDLLEGRIACAQCAS